MKNLNNPNEMLPKEFIQNVLITEFQDIVFRHQYLSFALVSIGIEFLGKCLLKNAKDWKSWQMDPTKAFNRGMDLMIEVDEKYKNLKLKELRNGFAHTLVPKAFTLSEIIHGDIHLAMNETTQKKILVAEIFYRDFVVACNKIIDMEFPSPDKMNEPLLKFIKKNI